MSVTTAPLTLAGVVALVLAQDTIPAVSPQSKQLSEARRHVLAFAAAVSGGDDANLRHACVCPDFSNIYSIYLIIL